MKAIALPSQNNLLGIFYMIAHVIALAVLYTFTKRLTKALDPSIIVFLYKLSILICILPWCLTKGIKGMHTNRIGLHIVRGFLSVFAQICMFCGIKYLPVADVTAVQYLEHIIVMIIGILYFKEKLTGTKTIAMILSFFGAIFVIRHDIFTTGISLSPNSFSPYYGFVFAALCLYAINNTTVKILGKTESTKVQLFYVTLFSCIFASPIAFVKWEPLTTIGLLPINYPAEIINFSSLGLKWEHIGSILFLALCYFVHAVCYYKAFKLADISTVIPFEYSRLIFAALLAIIFLGEIPHLHSLIGYALIIIGGFYAIYKETKNR